MSVNWKDDSSPARLYAYAAAHVSGEFDCTVPTWDIYCDLREAMIWALLITGFPSKSQWAITESNWKQVYKRLYVLERTRGCYRRYNNGHHKVREMYFTPAEVRSMIGLEVNAGNKSDAEFKNHINRLLMEDAEARLKNHEAEKLSDDKYAWERRQMNAALGVPNEH